MANLFSDGFETGNANAWTFAETDGGDLSVTTASKLHGTYGLALLLNDTNDKYVYDETPAGETRYRCRFYIDPNSFTSPDAEITIFTAQNEADAATFSIQLSHYTDNLIYCTINLDSGSTTTSSYAITDTPHLIEVDWKASSGAGANNGTFELRIDNIIKEVKTGLDTDTKVVDEVLMGFMFGQHADQTGTVFFDDFASNDDGSVIGRATTFTPATTEYGMGINSQAIGNDATFDRYIDIMLAHGITKIRVDIVTYHDTDWLASSKAAVLRAIAKGAQVIWGVASYVYDAFPTITSTNWTDLHQAILDAAAWAQANGVYEFQLGSEDEGHVDGTTMTPAQFIANIKTTATEVQAIFTNGDVTYACAAVSVLPLFGSSIGDLDKLGITVYKEGTYASNGLTYQTTISNIADILGSDNIYIAEFGVNSTSLDTYSTDEVRQTEGIAEMAALFNSLGISPSVYFKFESDEFGAVDWDGVTYKKLWDFFTPSLRTNLPWTRAASTTRAASVARPTSAVRSGV